MACLINALLSIKFGEKEVWKVNTGATPATIVLCLSDSVALLAFMLEAPSLVILKVKHDENINRHLK